MLTVTFFTKISCAEHPLRKNYAEGGIMSFTADDLIEFNIHHDRGFLPWPDPLVRLPKAFSPWEELATNMPKLLAAQALGEQLKKLPVLSTTSLRGAQWHRAMLLLSYLADGSVWEKWRTTPNTVISQGVAVPLYTVAAKIGRPPILSYASYALENWRRIDPKGPIALGNIALLQNFLGGVDEEWFILVHVDIEAKASPALHAMPKALRAARNNNEQELEQALLTIAASLAEMYKTLRRMPEQCDPYIYFNRVRPYIHGWKDHPQLPGGVIYEGVKEYGGIPQQFRGETGAQSSIVPSLDAILDIQHAPSRLSAHLAEMRDYMPPEHCAFLKTLEYEAQNGASVRNYVVQHAQDNRPLRNIYNECVTRLWDFRKEHLGYAGSYINKQAERSPYNPTGTGTGGTEFMASLKKHCDETLEHLIQ